MSARTRFIRPLAIGGMLAVTAIFAAGCSSSGGAEGTSITFAVDNEPSAVAAGQALIDAFQKENPDITVTLNPRPGGTDGDNLIKTRLSTGDMDDVFLYNSGSLLQALQPDKTLANLSDESWTADLTDDFKTVVSTGGGLYGAPWGTSFAGGVMYNKTVYSDLGLKIPTTWAEFISNSKTIKAAGIAPVIQTFGDTWTSQLFVLGDFANVATQQPDWAENYTNGQQSYTKQPAFAAFQHQSQVFSDGLLNENFASALSTAGLKQLADGTGAQYPMLTALISTVQQNSADKVNDIGVFALPAENADDTALTLWLPNALYIPKSTEGAELEAAKQFVAFANSNGGCTVQNETLTPAGPYATTACTLPTDVPALIADIQSYIDSGKTSPALEFLSPVKGPNLEKIAVEVGSGITTPEDGAKRYDQDLAQQADQLGLDW